MEQSPEFKTITDIQASQATAQVLAIFKAIDAEYGGSTVHLSRERRASSVSSSSQVGE